MRQWLSRLQFSAVGLQLYAVLTGIFKHWPLIFLVIFNRSDNTNRKNFLHFFKQVNFFFGYLRNLLSSTTYNELHFLAYVLPKCKSSDAQCASLHYVLVLGAQTVFTKQGLRLHTIFTVLICVYSYNHGIILFSLYVCT